jgi:signal transduction histidine kinase
MKFVPWRWFRDRPLLRLAKALARLGTEALELLRIQAPEPKQMLSRIEIMEQNIILPFKAAGIVMLLHSFFAKQSWLTLSKKLDALEIAVESTRYLLLLYILVNVVVAGLLLAKRRLPLPLVQWIVFSSCLMDGILLGALTLLTYGYNSPLYWLFLALIVRSAVSVPRATSQLLLNLTLSACYVVAGALDVSIAHHQNVAQEIARGAVAMGADIEAPLNPGLTTLDNPAEPLFLRLALLMLMTICCYGVQVLLERQRRAVEEAREFAMREGQLRAAGRLAAEFTHQIKNPLAIINNAAFSLQRALKQGKPANEQIRIIQEEVEHSDRIITQIMGYAQLSEGHVEKLDVIEELDRAIERVFPRAAGFPVRVHRKYAPPFPPLVMQRRHLFDAFVNVLQNARDALGAAGGNAWATVRCRDDYSIEVTLRDDGPGISPDKLGKIFEAYYTTKDKGTGLGLATVKTNVELYGGTVRVESELGKGASFILLFPARTLMKATEQL